MKRRNFLGAMPAIAPALAAMMPQLAQAQTGGLATPAPAPTVAAMTRGLKLKIKDVRVRKIKLVKEMGSLKPRDGLGGGMRRFAIGGDNITEVISEDGLIGIGPGVSPEDLRRAKEILVGKDAMETEALAYYLFAPERGGGSVEIALWDLVGKALKVPLYKLWGGGNPRIRPYASQSTVGTPEERARMAKTVQSQGWRGIKFRAHFENMKDDIALVELTRKAVGDDFRIHVDANQAGTLPDGYGAGLPRWDVKRAIDTARAYDAVKVFWLEEPMPMWDYHQITQIADSVDMYIAGHERGRYLHEYRTLLEKNVYDVYNCEVLLSGPTVLRQIANLVMANGKIIVPHVGGGTGTSLGTICHGHLIATWQTTPTWEIFNEPPVSDIFAQWTVFEEKIAMDKDGHITLPDGPGLGVTIKPELLIDA